MLFIIVILTLFYPGGRGGGGGGLSATVFGDRLLLLHSFTSCIDTSWLFLNIKIKILSKIWIFEILLISRGQNLNFGILLISPPPGFFTLDHTLGLKGLICSQNYYVFYMIDMSISFLIFYFFYFDIPFKKI